MTGIEIIAAERKRQMTVEGWSASHDAAHTDQSIARAAACYAMPERFRPKRFRGLWAWGMHWWKPDPDDRVRELAKAGALIAAEIDRLHAKADLEFKYRSRNPTQEATRK